MNNLNSSPIRKAQGKQFKVHSSQRRTNGTVNCLLSTVHKRHRRSGFTLIELLVVAAIIVILASVGTFSYTNAKKKGRDAKRKEDIRSLQSVLLLYSQNHKGAYPSCTAPNIPTSGSTTCDLNTISFPLGEDLAPTYINQLPVEPGLKTNSSNTGGLTPARYHYIGTGSAGCNASGTCINFLLTACLENSNDKDKDSALETGCTGGAASFTLKAPN